MTRADPTESREVARFVDVNYPTARFPDWHFRGGLSGPHTVVVQATRIVHLPVYGTVTVTAESTATNRTDE